jgi:triacylglycerol esterase/lipase EstA (alpha/beta hydrolase family)
VGTRHPDAAVDIIAHSQGGIIARTFLASTRAWDPRIPRVEHLVTFATPHRGAPLAGAARTLRNGSIGERVLVDSLSALSRRYMGLPGPRSTAVAQLAPGSDLLDGLEREDVAFGTRALALAIPNDLLVPADRARWEGERNRVVAPTGGPAGHSGIVRSAMARAVAHSFLRDGAPSCAGDWDAVGPSIGAAISALEASVPDTLKAAGAWATGRVDRVARPVGRLLRSGVARLWRSRG